MQAERVRQPAARVDGSLASPRAVFLLTLLFLALLTHARVFRGGNDASRFALVESLVERGETHIDDSRYAWTTDTVLLGGRRYSNKPPVLSLAAALLYLPLRLAGLSFAEHEGVVVYLLTLTLVGVPVAWLAARFHACLGLYDIRPAQRGLLTVALAAGTVLTSFSVTLSSHAPAAALLFAACVAAWGQRPWLAGVCASLAFCVDLAVGAVFLPAVALIAWRRSGAGALTRTSTAIALGGALFALSNAAVHGSILPPLLATGAVDVSGGSKAGGGVLVNLPTLPFGQRLTHAVAALFGSHGFLSVSPVLLLGVFGLAVAIKRGEPASRPVSAVLALAAAATMAGHLLFVGSFGGWSYGYRYLIPLVPILLFFAPCVLGDRVWPLAGALAVSLPLALLGAYNPWPPVWEPETPTPALRGIDNPVGANLSAVLYQVAPGSALAAAVSARFVSPDPRIRNRYLYFFHLSKGELEGAFDVYRDELRRHPTAETHFDFAEVLAAQGRLAEAIRHYAVATRLDPENRAAKRRLAETLRRARGEDGAPR